MRETHTMARKKHRQGEPHGRSADRPPDIPKAGWRDILKRVQGEQSKDNISMVAAGVAFYMLFAVVPGLAAAVSIYALVADPAQLQSQIQSLSGMMPDQARSILEQQLTRIVSQAGGALTFGLIGGLLLTLWSSTKGMKALMTALNIAYDEDESRGFVKLNAVAFALTLGAILGGLLAIVMVVVVPVIFEALGLGGLMGRLISWLRWPLLALVFVLSLAALYRYAPNRSQPQWQWVSAGAVGATLLWLLGSLAFSIYVRNFGSYNETYGSLGAVVILLMWFWLSAYVVLLGAELNAEMERQTRRDTTAGRPEPMGERGAAAADTVAGQSPGKARR